jgi:VWFA-related protein
MICPRKLFVAGCVLWLVTPLVRSQAPAAQPGAAKQVQQSQPPPRAPQTPQVADDPRAKIRARAELVVVPVTVKNDSGGLVADLRQEEFRVLEDGAEQRLEVFSNEAFPLSVVILIDNELPPKTAEQVEKSLPAFAGGFSDQDEVAVARFDLALHRAGDFTASNDTLLTQLQRLDLDKDSMGGPPGGPFNNGPRINGAPAPGTQAQSPANIQIGRRSTKNIDDAVYAAAELLGDRPRERRKIIVLVSDGNNSKYNTYSFADTVKLLVSSGISVYSVGVGNAVANRSLSLVAKYARATGGDVFYGAKRETLEDLYSAVTEEARNQYTLAYAPRNADRSVDFHSIEVRVRRPGLTILTRDGYYTSGKP